MDKGGRNNREKNNKKKTTKGAAKDITKENDKGKQRYVSSPRRSSLVANELYLGTRFQNNPKERPSDLQESPNHN